MREPQEAQFICSVCHAAFTQRDIDRGVAVMRRGEVLCIEHFEERYPGECVNHPGSKATEKCDQCGRMFCKDCIIELAGETACPKCKPVRMAEIFTGRQIEPPERKEKPHIPTEKTMDYIKHLAEERKKEEYKRLASPDAGEVDPATSMVVGAVFSVLVPFVGIAVIMAYRRRLKVLFDKGYARDADKAHNAYRVAVGATVFWSVMIPLIFILSLAL